MNPKAFLTIATPKEENQMRPPQFLHVPNESIRSCGMRTPEKILNKISDIALVLRQSGFLLSCIEITLGYPCFLLLSSWVKPFLWKGFFWAINFMYETSRNVTTVWLGWERLHLSFLPCPLASQGFPRGTRKCVAFPNQHKYVWDF